VQIRTLAPGGCVGHIAEMPRQHALWRAMLRAGFPDAEGPDSMKRAAGEALLTYPNQYAPMVGLPDLRAAVASYAEVGTLAPPPPSCPSSAGPGLPPLWLCQTCVSPPG